MFVSVASITAKVMRTFNTVTNTLMKSNNSQEHNYE